MAEILEDGSSAGSWNEDRIDQEAGLGQSGLQAGLEPAGPYTRDV